MLNVITWLWKQRKSWYDYTANDVNIWAAMVSRNLSMPHRLCCVTDMPRGIDSAVEIIPLPKVPEVKNKYWKATQGKPQSYCRLDMWRRDAAEKYGRRFVSMDLDCVVTGQLDPLLDRKEDVVLAPGSAEKRPYNGSMQLLTAGSRPFVYDRFNHRLAEKASSLFVGSDQAWLAFALGWLEATWEHGEKSGYYQWQNKRYKEPPKNCRIMFFHGNKKPRDLMQKEPWIKEYYRE